MKNSFVLIKFLILCGVIAVDCRHSKKIYERLSPKDVSKPQNEPSVDPGQPLFLTPLIESGQIQEALQKSLAQILPIVTSHSGFITVDDKSGANLFFWFFDSFKKPASQQPVCIWLNGGPGWSSLFGLFIENGPLQVDKNMKVSLKNNTWNDFCNMLYIDNPVGTGFSFTNDDSGYVTDENGVANDLYAFLVQFYQLFPDLTNNPIFVAGESYGGKFVTAAAAKIAMMEKFYEAGGKANPVAKLGGILVGDGITDPESMLPPRGDHLFALGLLNEQQREYFNQQYDVAVYLIQQGLFKEANDIDGYMFLGDSSPYPTYFNNATGCSDFFNVLNCNQDRPQWGYFDVYVQMNETRAKIHVGSRPYGATDDMVEDKLVNDMLNTCKPQFEYLLTQTEIPVLYYSGNLDLIVPTVSTDNFLRSLDWPYKEQWLHANRTIWFDGQGNAVSYSMTVNQLTYEVIRNAGHLGSTDQPEVIWRTARDFIRKTMQKRK